MYLGGEAGWRGKGITPVVAVVLLLLLAVGIAGGTYVFVSGITETTEEETRTRLQTSMKLQQLVCSRGAVEATVQNTGDAAVTDLQANLFVYNHREEIVSHRSGIDVSDMAFTQPGELDTFTAFLTAPLNHTQQYTVELVFGSQTTVSGRCIVNASYLDAAAVYTMDEGTGRWVNDSTVNRNNGRLEGDPQWVDGQAGSALLFDGDGDIVNVSSSQSLNITEAITISAWVKSEEQLGATVRRDWVSKTLAYTMRNDNRSNRCDIGSPGPLFHAQLTDDSFYGAGYCGDTPPETGAWHQFTGTYNPGTGFSLWTDGEHIRRNTNHPGLPLMKTAHPLIIGGHLGGDGSLVNMFHGVIDEVHIYSRATR